jgi:hypothetical protein
MTRLALLRRSFPTPGLIFRWIGKSRRRIWCLVMVLVAIVAGPPLWWATQLVRLPDVGDPFDVAAFRAYTIPDERNAFVLYRQAATLIKPNAGFPKTWTTRVDMLARWPMAVPELRQWAEENREALAVYRQGTERPDALEMTIGFDRESFKTFQALSLFRPMILLEASRLEDQGDMAGAWGWYRALLRTVHHVGMHGTVYRRSHIQRWHRQFRERMTTWAAEPRTTPALLRRALDDVVACEALAPSELDSLKAGYLDANWLLNSPTNPGHEVPFMRFRRFWNPDYQLNPEQIQAIWDWWRFWRREPERSRRVIRLVTANWLAYHELPPGNRPKPDPNVASLDAYPLGPRSPAMARILSPTALDRWFDTAYDAQQVLRFLNPSGVRTLEQANDGDIIMLLGTELYRRDHGTDPPTPEALVGPYLKSLPVDYQAGKKDDTIPGARGTQLPRQEQ